MHPTVLTLEVMPRSGGEKDICQSGETQPGKSTRSKQEVQAVTFEIPHHTANLVWDDVNCV